MKRLTLTLTRRERDETRLDAICVQAPVQVDDCLDVALLTVCDAVFDAMN